MPDRVVTETRRKRALRLREISLSLVIGLAVGVTDAKAQQVPTDRLVLQLDIGWRLAPRPFVIRRVFPVFSELGSLRADHQIQGRGITRGGFSLRLWRNLGVGFDLSNHRSLNSALITSRIPHPFFFDSPRTTKDAVNGMKGKQVGIHSRALLMMKVTDWLTISVSGGPSLINLQQELVAEVAHKEIEYPYEEILVSGRTVHTSSGNTIGLNGGVDIDAFVLDKIPLLGRFDVMKNVGLGLLIRHVRGSAHLKVVNESIEVNVSGLRVTTGLRIRF